MLHVLHHIPPTSRHKVKAKQVINDKHFFLYELDSTKLRKIHFVPHMHEKIHRHLREKEFCSITNVSFAYETHPKTIPNF